MNFFECNHCNGSGYIYAYKIIYSSQYEYTFKCSCSKGKSRWQNYPHWDKSSHLSFTKHDGIKQNRVDLGEFSEKTDQKEDKVNEDYEEVSFEEANLPFH